MNAAPPLVLLVVLVSAPAEALVLCTMPDGKPYAGDKPPPGCTVKNEYPSTPAEPERPPEAGSADSPETGTAQNTADARAIVLRRDLERRADAAAEELAGVRQRLVDLPTLNPALYPNTTEGWVQYEEDVRAREALTQSLRVREGELVDKIAGLRRDFAEVTADLAKAHGGTAPSWWSELRCAKCP